MSRYRTWARTAVVAGVVAAVGAGCNPLTTIGFLLHRDAKVPAAYPLKPKDGPDGKPKEVVVVAILAGTVGPIESFAGVEREVAGMMAQFWPEMIVVNGGKEKVRVLTQSEVETFKMSHPTWRTMSAAAIGKKLGADYLLDMTLQNLQMYQPGSNRQIYEGKAEVSVQVFDVAGGKEPTSYSHNFSFPKGLVRDSGNMPAGQFRQQYTRNLAIELVEYHIEHKPSDGIASDR